METPLNSADPTGAQEVKGVEPAEREAEREREEKEEYERAIETPPPETLAQQTQRRTAEQDRADANSSDPQIRAGGRYFESQRAAQNDAMDRIKAKMASDATGGLTFYRRGDYDSKSTLTRQASEAEAAENIGIHGVSVSLSSAARPGQVVRSATEQELRDAGLPVRQTGRDPNHHTVQLPRPITNDVVNMWNNLFK